MSVSAEVRAPGIVLAQERAKNSAISVPSRPRVTKVQGQPHPYALLHLPQHRQRFVTSAAVCDVTREEAVPRFKAKSNLTGAGFALLSTREGILQKQNVSYQGVSSLNSHRRVTDLGATRSLPSRCFWHSVQGGPSEVTEVGHQVRSVFLWWGLRFMLVALFLQPEKGKEP